MVEDTPTVEQLQAELRQVRERHAAEIGILRDEKAALLTEVEQRDRALAEVLEQQAATAEILRVIADSPTDLQAVLDTIVRNAVRLCDAAHSTLHRVVDAEHHQPVATFGVGVQPH